MIDTTLWPFEILQLGVSALYLYVIWQIGKVLRTRHLPLSRITLSALVLINVLLICFLHASQVFDWLNAENRAGAWTLVNVLNILIYKRLADWMLNRYPERQNE